MIFPIGDDQVKGGSFPLFSYGFLVLNVLVFLFQVSMPVQQQEAFVFQFGTIPAEIMSGEDYFTLLSSMFLHGGWLHLIGNMVFLWVFADNIEATIGNLLFLLFYLLGGLAAAAVHIAFNTASMIPTVGASGAIAAVLGAYLVMFPRSKVRVFIFLFIFFNTFSIPAFLFLGIWIAQQVVFGMTTIGADPLTAGVAWWAHIGGFVFGVIAGFFARGRAREFSIKETPPADLV